MGKRLDGDRYVLRTIVASPPITHSTSTAVRCSSLRVLAILLLALLAMACGKEPATVVVEGDISPELAISGQTWFRASRDVFLCKRNLFQSPQPKSWHAKGTVIQSGSRYTLRFDLQDSPQGGLCGWRLQAILLDAHLRSRPIVEHSLGILSNVQNLPAHRQAEEPRLAPNATLRCDIRPDTDNILQCDSTQRAIDTNAKEVRLTLNLKYENGHQWVND